MSDTTENWPPYRPVGAGFAFWPFKWKWEICRKYHGHFSVDAGPFVFWFTWE